MENTSPLGPDRKQAASELKTTRQNLKKFLENTFYSVFSPEKCEINGRFTPRAWEAIQDCIGYASDGRSNHEISRLRAEWFLATDENGQTNAEFYSDLMPDTKAVTPEVLETAFDDEQQDSCTALTVARQGLATVNRAHDSTIHFPQLLSPQAQQGMAGVFEEVLVAQLRPIAINAAQMAVARVSQEVIGGLTGGMLNQATGVIARNADRDPEA